MKTVVLDCFPVVKYGEERVEKLHELGEVTYYDKSNDISEDELIQRIGDADAIFMQKPYITRRVIEACPSLKYIGEIATGFNNIDVEAASEHGIAVTNVPAYASETVAQHTIAMLLEITNHVGYYNKAVQDGLWCKSKYFCYLDRMLLELSGKTFGLLGCGKIGVHTARMAQGFGMKVITYSRPNEMAKQLGVEYVDLDSLFARSDVLVLSMPLTDLTRGIICKDNIAKMKDGVIIINPGRGPMVVEQDLADALNSGKVAAAAVDVVSHEPIEETNPLLGAKNCIITPHISWAAREAKDRLLNTAINNFVSWIEGNPENVVNKI